MSEALWGWVGYKQKRENLTLCARHRVKQWQYPFNGDHSATAKDSAKLQMQPERKFSNILSATPHRLTDSTGSLI